MAEQTTSSIVIDADPATIMEVIADFAAYPTWAKGVKAAEVVSTYDDGRGERVRYVLDVPPIRDEYTLAYHWRGPERVTWTLVEGRVLTSLDGEYALADLGGGRTEVTYRLMLDTAIPLIGMIKRKGEKMIIDAALRGLKQRVESR